MTALLIAAITAVMAAPPTTEPGSCPTDMASSTEPAGTGLLSADDAEYRDLLDQSTAYAFGEPVELAPGPTITVTDVVQGEPNMYGDPVVVANLRYENTSDAEHSFFAGVLCTGAIGTEYYSGVTDVSPDSEVNTEAIRARSLDEGVLSVLVPSAMFDAAECGDGQDWLVLDDLWMTGDEPVIGRWPVCGDVTE